MRTPAFVLNWCNCCPAAGPHGMVGGQMLDLIAEGENFDIGTIRTPAASENRKADFILLRGRRHFGESQPRPPSGLRNYAQDLGLAFR